ncbi:MAG: YkgJ family cysteine cluster protein [Candidatus Gastranaerophilaceae bacterium]
MSFIEAIKKFIYKHIFRKKYYRSGSCNRCGACCTRIYVSHMKGTVKTEEEFKKLRMLHPFYTYLTIEGQDEMGLLFSCCNFDREKHICKIHKKRPGICRRYPDEVIFSHGACLTDDCGYNFTPIDKFSEILKNTEKKPVKSYRILDK